MSDSHNINLAGDLIQFQLPPQWSWHPDEAIVTPPSVPLKGETGGGAVPPERDCVLHFRAERVEDPTELPNLSRMMASFLTYHVRPVATDELHSFNVGGGLGFAWQYMEEWEGDPTSPSGPIQAIRVWVVGNEVAWVFINFQGPREIVRQRREAVEEVISSLQFR